LYAELVSSSQSEERRPSVQVSLTVTDGLLMSRGLPRNISLNNSVKITLAVAVAITVPGEFYFSGLFFVNYFITFSTYVFA